MEKALALRKLLFLFIEVTGRLVQPYPLDILHKKEIKFIITNINGMENKIVLCSKTMFFCERSHLWMVL